MARQSLTPTELNVHQLASTGDDFLDRVGRMRNSLEEIDQRIRTMHQVQDSILGQTIVRPEDKDQLDTLIEEIRHRAHSLRSNVRILEEELVREEARGMSNATRRIRQNQCDQMRRRLNEVLQTFYSAQEDYKQRVTRRVKRQLDLAGEQLEQSEVERMLENQSEQIFYRHISPINFAAQMALEDASNRHSELLKLEQSIKELNDCFSEMHDLVHTQGALVDRIETNVESAADYTSQARMQMKRAEVFNKSAQRMKCIIVLVVVGLILLLFLILLIVVMHLMPSGSH